MAALINEKGNPIDPINTPMMERTFELDDENIYHEHILQTDWPDACEITSLDDEYHITTVKLDSLDDMNPVVDELRHQGWGLSIRAEMEQ